MKKMIRSILVTMLLPFALYSCEYPKVIIHKDINKTMIAEDPSGQKAVSDVLIHALAEQYKDKWDDIVLQPTSFSEYIKNHKLPGNKADKELKKRRNAAISNFIAYLKETNHPQCEQITKRYEQLQKKVAAHKSIIFNSCYREIEYLTKNKIPYSFVLRTFGQDLDRVMAEMRKQISPGFFDWKGIFGQDGLMVESLVNDEIYILKSTAEIYQFLKTHGNIALQDDWKQWNDNGERQQYGKLFPIDLQDKSVVTYFADDNANPADGILNPRDANTNAVLDVSTLIASNHIQVVDPIAAIEDDEYYVNHLKKLLSPN